VRRERQMEAGGVPAKCDRHAYNTLSGCVRGTTIASRLPDDARCAEERERKGARAIVPGILRVLVAGTRSVSTRTLSH